MLAERQPCPWSLSKVPAPPPLADHHQEIAVSHSFHRPRKALAVAAVTALSAFGAFGGASAQADTSTAYDYECTGVVLNGPDLLHLQISTTFPDYDQSVRQGTPLPGFQVKLTSSPSGAGGLLDLLGAVKVTGTGTADVTAYAPGGTLALTTPLTISGSNSPDGSGLQFTASGVTPPVTFTTAGQASVFLSHLSLTLEAYDKSGTPIRGLGSTSTDPAFTSSCTTPAYQPGDPIGPEPGHLTRFDIDSSTSTPRPTPTPTSPPPTPTPTQGKAFDYECTYPVVGPQPVYLDVETNIPTTVTTEVEQPGFAIPLNATSLDQTYSMLHILSAQAVEGTGVATLTVTQSNGTKLHLSVPVKLDKYLVPPTDPEAAGIQLVARGVTPPVTFSPAGAASVTFDGLSLRL